VVGQVTRVFPLQAEVTLITDRDLAIPVQVLRTGLRSVIYGTPKGDALDLRFVPTSSDLVAGDELVTSGLDGVYPPGLPVAKVVRVDKLADTAFARVTCAPIAAVRGAREMLVLHYRSDVRRARPSPSRPTRTRRARKARRRGEGRQGEGRREREAGRRTGRDARGSGSGGARAARGRATRSPAMNRPQYILQPVNPYFIVFSLAAAFLLNLMPWGRLPGVPDFVALVLLFWNIHQPRKVGMGVAFALGI
jgi:rod shape-determining protein MreC